jgi:hypothetical protein
MKNVISELFSDVLNKANDYNQKFRRTKRRNPDVRGGMQQYEIFLRFKSSRR